MGKPRVLILEPVPNMDSGNGSNAFKLQLETQEALKRFGLEFDLALSSSDARRMVSAAEPPYGMFLGTSEVGADVFSEIASRVRQRCKKAPCFICHNRKVMGELDESFRLLASQSELVAGIFERPLTKSRLDHVLRWDKSVNVKYPECGMGKAALVNLIHKRLSVT